MGVRFTGAEPIVQLQEYSNLKYPVYFLNMMFGLVLCSVLLMSLVDVNETTCTSRCNANGNNDLILPSGAFSSDGVRENMEAALADTTFVTGVINCMSAWDVSDPADCDYSYGNKTNACLCEYLANGCQSPLTTMCSDDQQTEYAAIQSYMKSNQTVTWQSISDSCSQSDCT